MAKKKLPVKTMDERLAKLDEIEEIAKTMGLFELSCLITRLVAVHQDRRAALDKKKASR
jgi:hypothetical protein